MFIAIDIGNTNVTLGVFKNEKLLRVMKFPTPDLKAPKKAAIAWGSQLGRVCPEAMNRAESVYACSVVPAFTKGLRDVVKTVFKHDLKIVGEDVTVPIYNRYRIPGQVGQDRLVNAYAALKKYGPGLIIIDFGTAITFDIVSKNGEYLGGLITPGFKLMQESLNKNTALLPYVELARPIEIIGKDTVSSIRSGLVYGAASLCDGIVQRLLEKECKGYKVIATGGDVALVRPYVKHINRIEDSLILSGLALIYKSQATKK
jgi:type III pantothenate kinase